MSRRKNGSAPPNLLFCGDNLEVLREELADESVDLIYLDPPFNSDQNFNVLYSDAKGRKSAAQQQVFEDTWVWNQAAKSAYQQTVEHGGQIADALRAFHAFLDTSPLMAYMSMMAPRLIELRRVLRRTGALYLHCDPNASHYLKVLLDAVFGSENFANEIVWRRTTTKNDYKQGAVNWPRVHDTLLMYYRSKREARESNRFEQPLHHHRDDRRSRRRARGRARYDDRLSTSDPMPGSR